MKLTQEQVLGLIRHALTFAGGILLMKGLVDESTWTEVSGALLAVVGGIWSFVVKK
jgi:hypothetical protein